MSDYARLVEQARELLALLSRSGPPQETFARGAAPLLAGLADAVEQLQDDRIVDGLASELAEARARVAVLEAALRDHDDCRVCCALLDLVPSAGQETT